MIALHIELVTEVIASGARHDGDEVYARKVVSDRGSSDEGEVVFISKRLEKAGYAVEEVSMPILKYGLAIYYVVQPAEVASNLSRYDGIRYGHRAAEFDDLDGLYANTRNEGFMPENKRRIMIGNFVLSSGFFACSLKIIFGNWNSFIIILNRNNFNIFWSILCH